MNEEIVALLYTDVVNSTLLNAQWGDEVMARLWTAHDAAARHLIRTCGGREVGRGDGFLVIFPDSDKAVAFAAAYHRTLISLEPTMEARVGIHVGPIVLRQNSAEDIEQGATRFDIDGVALPLVARIMAVALGRQTLLSDSALSALGPTPFETQSHGHWRLKGVPEPVELIEIGEAKAPFVPPPDSIKSYRVVRADNGWIPVAELPNTLPTERDTFIGRLEELQALTALLDNGARVVTLLGIGGIGKTRLAVRYARCWLGEYPGGAWFCDLSAARALEGIVQAVAQGLEVPLGKADPVHQLGSAMAGRHECLFILDNFEQVARYAEEALGTWLELAPQAKFVVTSREVLGIAGEHTLVLGPLRSDDAAQMFRTRARALGLKSSFDASDESAIDPLVDLLDRLPLAIELAAARTRVMRPRVLLKRMGDRFKVLTSLGGRRDRQATLRATLDWSWDLLSAAEKLALVQLSVFEGGFGLAAAEHVINALTVDKDLDPATLVQSLLEKSLVLQRSGDRFDLLSTVQEYAAERLKSLDDSRSMLLDAHTRHAEFFATLDRRDTTVLCTERANLVVATRRAAAGGRTGTAIAALEGAWSAFKLRGPFSAALELAEEVRRMVNLDRAGAARADCIAGWAMKASGRVNEAEPRLAVALQEAKAASDRECEGYVSSFLGEVLVNLGRVQEGRTQIESALGVALELGNELLECEARTGLGNLCRQLGLSAEAHAQYSACLQVAQKIGDRRWEGGSLGNLGTACMDRGDTVQAEAHFQSALTVARELGDRQWEGNALCNLGLLHQEQGELEPARAELQAALFVARELGYTRLECIVLCNLGIVLDASNLHDEARGHYEAALKLARIQGDRRTEGQVLGYLGLLHFRGGRHTEGRACLEDGERHLMEVSDQMSLAILYCGRAEGELLAGVESTSAAALEAARRLASALGAKPGTELGLALARVRALAGRLSTTESSGPATVG